jgi:hypothetical protein
MSGEGKFKKKRKGVGDTFLYNPEIFDSILFSMVLVISCSFCKEPLADMRTFTVI